MKWIAGLITLAVVLTVSVGLAAHYKDTGPYLQSMDRLEGRVCPQLETQARKSRGLGIDFLTETVDDLLRREGETEVLNQLSDCPHFRTVVRERIRQ